MLSQSCCDFFCHLKQCKNWRPKMRHAHVWSQRTNYVELSIDRAGIKEYATEATFSKNCPWFSGKGIES